LKKEKSEKSGIEKRDSRQRSRKKGMSQKEEALLAKRLFGEFSRLT
jgi:hypothetical protein